MPLRIAAITINAFLKIYCNLKFFENTIKSISLTSTKSVKMRAIHPPKLKNIVINDNCPVLLFWKFNSICGLLEATTNKK